MKPANDNATQVEIVKAISTMIDAHQRIVQDVMLLTKSTTTIINELKDFLKCETK